MSGAGWPARTPLERGAAGRERIIPTVFALGLLAYWIAGLGAAPLFDVDEGAFAQASREMLASRDWWHTTLNGADRFDKPILVYWLQAASMSLFGRNEFAVRLPSALCAWLWCIATAAFVQPRWGRAAAACSAVILATSAGPLMIGRAATADALLNLLLALALFDLARFVEGKARQGEADAGSIALRRAALWMGLGVLAKGPVAVVVPLGALLLWACVVRAGAWRLLARAARDPWAWVIGAAVSVPWYAYALNRHGWAFIDGFVMRHNVERFTGTLEGHGGSLYYYLLALPMLMLPWTPLLAPMIVSLWRGRRARFAATPALLVAWAAFVLVFFSFSGTKLPHYALYGYTPIAVLAAAWLARRPAPSAVVFLVLALCAAIVILGAYSPELAASIGARQKDVFWRALTRRDTLDAGPALSWAALVLLCILAAAAWARQRGQAAGAACAGAALAVGLWFNTQVIPWWGETLQGPVKRFAAEAALRGLPLVQWRLHQPSAGFYRDAPAPRRDPLPGEAALTRIDRMDAPGQERTSPVRVISQERGLALVVVPPSPAPPAP